jgi:methylated-DNA-[protein]-cysteine S-methyltransferase
LATEKNNLHSLKWGTFKAGKGTCAAAWTPNGLSALVLPRSKREEAIRGLNEYLPPLPADFWEKLPSKVPTNVQKEVKRALKAKPFRLYPFDLSFLTAFQQKVLAATCQIPWGQVRTYAWVAGKAGSPRGFRAAGQALNRNPIPIFIPCHRVIASGSKLGGYGGGLDWKVRLLKNEGIAVNRGMVKLVTA